MTYTAKIEALIAERDALQAENERLIQEQAAWRSFTEMANNTVSKAEAERDQLQSRLDAIGNGEAVAYGDAARRRGKQVGALWQFDDLGLSMFVGEIIGQRYAAPKALAPLTDEQIYETIIQWDEGGGKRSRRELARRLTRLTNQQQQVANLILHDGLQIASQIESNSGFGTDIEHRFEVSDGNKRLGVIVIFTELAAHGIHAKGVQQ